jgi:hypothetical protein
MSLTSFLESNADVRARFLTHFQKPHFHLKAPLLAPPLTENHGLAGTAFDYLLRFYVQKLSCRAKTQGWIAEIGLMFLSLTCSPAKARRAKRIVDEAKVELDAYLRSSNRRPPRKLIEATVKLARFDVIYRIGLLDPQLFARVPKRLIDDLDAMLALVMPRHFRAQKRCILNPRFGSASRLVAGADADLVIDDSLIDVKTSKHLTFERQIFNQIMGYYVLSCIGGVDGRLPAGIKHVGVYYARYGILHRISVAGCIARSDLHAFVRWFTKRAAK